uniref:ABC transporter substrate-binding protein n=1 Tax=Pararhizobium sp. IMCC3301 TaxID=3067904 RepID=UPI0027423BE7|nr:ABC transporter substrate-binding protein [Pararhizobium sp. IMCC3301]
MKYLSKAVASLAISAAMLLPSLAVAQELVLSIGSRGYGAAVEPAIESFEAANPGVKVEWLKISDVPGESRKLYVTSFLAKSPTPDVFAVDIIWPGEFAKRGWIAPLSDYFDAEDAAAYNEAFIEAATVDGEVYGIPLIVDGTLFFYRKDLLDKYDLAVPETWEEVIAAAKTVLDGENDPQLTGFVSMWAKIEGLFMNWLSFFYGNGGSFFDDSGNVAVASNEAIVATQTMVDLIYKHEIANESILNMRPDDARTLFQQGRSVFLMVQDFVYAPLSAEDSPVAGKFDFKRNPYFAGHEGAPSTAMGGFLLAVNANTENKDLAVALAKHLGSYDRQLWAAVNASKSPGRQDVYDDPAMADNEVLRKFGAAYAAGVVRPSAPTGSLYPKVSDVMQLEITNALHRTKTVEEALKDAEAAINKILDK